MSEKKESKKLLDMEIIRRDNIFLVFQVSKEIEDFFRKSRPAHSMSWSASDGDVSYYPKSDESEEFRFFMDKYYDAFGRSLFYVDSRQANVAIFRTVGCSERSIELKINQKYSEDTLQEIVRQYKKFVATLYKKFCRPVSIKCTMVEEVVV